MRTCAFLIILNVSISVVAQDILFANKNTFASQLNPALVSALSDLSVSSVYRTQWTNHPNQGYNSCVSNVMYAKGNVGAGLYIRNDWGLLNNFRHEFGVSINNTLKNEKLELRYGLKLNYIRNNLTGLEASGMSNIVNYWLGPNSQQKPPLQHHNPLKNELRGGIGSSLAIKDFLLGFSLSEFNISGKEKSFRPPLTHISIAYARSLGDFIVSSELSVLGYPTFFNHDTRSSMGPASATSLLSMNLSYRAFKIGSEFRLSNWKGLAGLMNSSTLFKVGTNQDRLALTYAFERINVSTLDFGNVYYFSHELCAAWHINGRKQNSKTERILQSLF